MKGKNLSLTNNDVRTVLGMIKRGDKQHDIAAWFGENQARIAEAEQGRHGQQQPANPDELPPKGAPGPKGRRLRAHVKKAIAHMQANETDKALEELLKGAKRYDAHED